MSQSIPLRLMVLVFICLLFGSIASAQEITHYTFASHAQSWTDHLKNMAVKFQAETGITVNVVQSSGSYQEQVTVMIAGGIPPDVTDFHPEIAGNFIADDLFEDLRPYIERGSLDMSQYPPIAIEGVTAPSGVMWGFPISVYPIVTFFNDDLFQQAGLLNPNGLADNWTWEAFQESAKRMTIDRSGDGIPDQWGTERVERLTGRWEQWVHQAGGRWYDRLVFPTESRFNTPEVLEAVRFLSELILEDQVAAPSGSHDFISGNGTVGMNVYHGPGIIGSYLQGLSFNWDIARLPRGVAGRAARVNPDGFQILRDSQNKEAAWQWIEYLVDSAEHQELFAQTTGRMPSHRDAMMGYNRLPMDLPDHWMLFIETAFDSDGYAAYVLSDEIRRTVNATMNQVWRGQQAPEQALDQLHELINALLSE